MNIEDILFACHSDSEIIVDSKLYISFHKAKETTISQA